MKTEHKIGIAALVYSLVSFVAVWLIVDIDAGIWTLLGSMVSMFNYGQLLTSSKNLNKKTMSLNIFVRYGVILAVMAFAYFNTDKNYITLIYVLIGLLASKIGLIVYYLLFHKKKVQDESEVNIS